MSPRGRAHGTAAAYEWCRKRPEGSCEDCREANAIYRRDKRPRADDGRHLMEFVDAEWMEHSACLGMASDLFFPERGEESVHAKATCDGCPVRARCLAYAIELGEKHGIWGGRSERERRAIRRSPVKRRFVVLAAELEAQNGAA